MAEGYLAADLLNLDYRVRRLERTAERKLMRREQDPFDLTNEEFIELYRITPRVATDLIDTLQAISQRVRDSGLSVQTQVLTAVRFYATGCYQRPVGDQWGISLSQSPVSRCIRDVTNAINERLLRPWVQFPMTPEDRRLARAKFVTARQPFEGAIGAIDCTHVALLGPREHEEAYVNHHRYHSLNVQAVCDPNLKILNINARYPGARNDSYIWSASPVRRIMEREYNRGERTFLIGDQGYPLEPWLMTPLAHEQVGTPRFNYNQALCSARNCVERLFGVLKSTWRCLSKHRVLQYEPGMAGKIVNACAVLHNMRINYGLPDIYEAPDEDVLNDGIMENMNDGDGNNLRPLAPARLIQDRQIEARFRI